MKAAAEKPGRVEVPSFWRCKCGQAIGAHREWCPCGRHKLESLPPKEKK